MGAMQQAMLCVNPSFTVSISGSYTHSASGGVGVATTCTINFFNDGRFSITSSDNGDIGPTTWGTPLSTTDAALYEVQLTTLVSGTFNTSAGAAGTWLALSSTRTWGKNAGAAATTSATAEGVFTLRKIGTTTPTWTVTANLTAVGGAA